MSTRTIGQIKTKIISRLHGTTLNKISDFYTLCEDAAETMLARIDPMETVRKAAFVNAVYDKVYDYAVATDFKAPANINVQADPTAINNSSLSRTYQREFSNMLRNNQFAVLWQDGVQFLRFNRSIHAPVVVDTADSTTANGTWSVGSSGSGLTLDTLNFVAGTGSLRMTTASPGAIVNVILRIGNSSANYYSKTITAGHFNAFNAGWNLLRFNLSDAVLTGTVDMTAIDYVRVTVTYNTSVTAYYEKTLTQALNLSGNYKTDGAVFAYMYFDSITSLTLARLDNITANLGTLFDSTYYSNCLFTNSAGTWIAKPTSDNDTVNLSSASYKIFEAELSKAITQQAQGAMGSFDYNYWHTALEGEFSRRGQQIKEGLYDEYTRQYPSERIDGTTSYYDTGIDTDNVDATSINGQPISYYN